MTEFEDKLDTVLVIDDEPFNTEWLTEYFKARGYKVVEASDLRSALDALEKTRYQYVVIDLSIPVSPALAQPLAALGTEFFRYPGLMAARRARSTGHATFQVIVYSVHESADVDRYTELIVCKYILKGRPRELKTHIESTMRRQPHGWRSLKAASKLVKSRPAHRGNLAAKKKVKPTPVVVKRKTRKSFQARYPNLNLAKK
jgi:CheY-like chemotaxis protein